MKKASRIIIWRISALFAVTSLFAFVGSTLFTAGIVSNATVVTSAIAASGSKNPDSRDSVFRLQTNLENDRSAPTTRFISGGGGWNHISIRSDGRTVRSVLQELSLRTGILIHADAIELDHTVSVNFVDSRLEDVLLELLRGDDIAFFYKSSENEEPVIASVSVYSHGTVADLPSVTMVGDVDSASEVQNASLLSPEHEQEDAGETQSFPSTEQVTRYLTDPDELRRTRALDVAMNNGIHIEPSMLAHLVQNDTSALVRFSALSAIGMLPTEDLRGAESVVVAALNDRDEPTRVYARLILESIRDRTK